MEVIEEIRNRLFREFLMNLLMVASKNYKAKHISISYHSKDHGYGVHNLIFVSKIPKDIELESGKNTMFNKLTISPDHDVNTIVGLKRRKLTIKVKHGREPIPFTEPPYIDELMSGFMEAAYKFTPTFKIVNFELHFGHLAFKIQGAEDFKTEDLTSLIEAIKLVGLCDQD